MKNYYSKLWFKFFMESVGPGQTQREVEFILRYLPGESYQSVLDVCCGRGRHSLLLAEMGYRVTGIDLKIISHAEPPGASCRVTYVELDMRKLSTLQGTFDGAINLWQSFGYFDDKTNADILRQIHSKLNPNGRFIMDIYHRGFFERHQGERCFERQGVSIRETKYMNGNELTVRLDYGPAYEVEQFNWRLYTPDEICRLAQEVGLEPLAVCTGFDEQRPASIDSARMQIVFEKR